MKKSIANAVAATLLGMCASVGAAKAEPINLNGKWVMGDGEGVLEIRGNDWFHPKYGSARIQYGTGSSDVEVFYAKEQGIRCAYRVNTIAHGDILVLEWADASQSSNYCPSGKLSRADK